MRRRSLAAAGLLALVVACGPPARPSLPTGTGTLFDGFATAYDQAVQECGAVQTITAELALSGRAGDTKLRGRISVWESMWCYGSSKKPGAATCRSSTLVIGSSTAGRWRTSPAFVLWKATVRRAGGAWSETAHRRGVRGLLQLHVPC